MLDDLQSGLQNTLVSLGLFKVFSNAGVYGCMMSWAPLPKLLLLSCKFFKMLVEMLRYSSASLSPLLISLTLTEEQTLTGAEFFKLKI